MKAAYYPNVGLEQMVPDQMWIEEECKHDIATIVVRTHMQILSVVRIKVFSMYGYDYMKKIVLHRADLNEHIIAERDFKYLYPSDFEDLHLLNLQGHLNHLPLKDKKILTTTVNLWTRHLVIRQRVEDFQLGIKSYQTQLNLTKPRWDATSFKYKHDFTIDEALEYRVKEFKVNRKNPGLNITFWIRKDVDRSKEFMFAIQKRLRTSRIFRKLKTFVGGRGLYKGTNLVVVAIDGNNQIVPIAFGICKGETGPCWSWWMSVLKECIDDNLNLVFISDSHVAIALALENEYHLAFHANIQKAISPRMDNPQPGRPKNTKRIQSQGEVPRVIHCSRCTQAGHRRGQCNKPSVVEPPVNISTQNHQEIP
nr:transposase, MuDR, MULE transposase domain protein [Tanacetum cinerariifolium]